jgi:tRNA 2-thiouridine synthesizing protein A
MNFDKELDARGLNCPLPILRAKKSLAELQSGQVLRIIATDPGSVKDFAAFAKQTGNELLASGKGQGIRILHEAQVSICASSPRSACRAERGAQRLRRRSVLAHGVSLPAIGHKKIVWLLHCDS